MSDAQDAHDNHPNAGTDPHNIVPHTIVEYADPVYTLEQNDQIINVILPTFIQSERIHSFGYDEATPSLPAPTPLSSTQYPQLPAPLPMRSQSSPAKVQHYSERRFSQDSGMFRDTSPYVSRGYIVGKVYGYKT